MKAIILCAGRGERLRPLTDTIPKPMVPIDNKPALLYNIELCKKHGILDIAINTSYLSEKIKEYFGDGSKFGVNIKYSFEKDLLGSSGALNNFKDFFKENFIVIYGDNLTNLDLTKLIKYHKKKQGIATICLRKKEKNYKTQSLIFADSELRLTSFLEKPPEEQVQKLSGNFKLINSGIYVLSPKIFGYIPSGFSDFAYDIFPTLIKKNENIYGFLIDDFYFREIGKIAKYLKAKEDIELGRVRLID